MCNLPNIPFSTYIKKPDNFNRTYMTGERITLACKKGFKEQPGGNPVRICINGLWTRFPFKCEGMLCMQRNYKSRLNSVSSSVIQRRVNEGKWGVRWGGGGWGSIEQNVTQILV